jgi:hypothetical protein
MEVVGNRSEFGVTQDDDDEVSSLLRKNPAVGLSKWTSRPEAEEVRRMSDAAERERDDCYCGCGRRKENELMLDQFGGKFKDCC